MEDKYLQRGVSAGKEEVHAAVRSLDQGLYPDAFCKIYPDWLGGDAEWCNVMSSDGCGTKSVLAYLYWRETGDLSVWRGIAQDALVMNLDDLVCVGATNRFLLTSIINRNKRLIPGEVIAEIISGTQAFTDTMRRFGVDILLTGGETADLGDVVRTVMVDASMAVRMRQSDLILTKRICPGDVIVGLASYGRAVYENEYNSGISSNGLTNARHDLLSKRYAAQYPETYDPSLNSDVVYTGSKGLLDPLPGTPLTIGKALLSPTRTFAPVVKKILQELPGKIHGIINCTGGAHSKVLHYIAGLRVVKNNLLPVPPLFEWIQRESATPWSEMYKVLNCGTRMEIYTDAAHADAAIMIAKEFNVDAQVIGYVEEAREKEVLLRTPQGEFTYH
ncbi:MAG: AIR synthase-related protein [Chitinophagales bacterium]|nr:AIR synthase-related protein [Chitinophagales bacterium]MDW8419531.1 AIR synthase-related protein [Chitinophagales bacterium]